MKIFYCILLSIFVVTAATSGSEAAPKKKMSDVDCVIEPHMTVELSSPVAGILDEVSVKRGDRVQEGQVVARLKSGVEEAGVKFAEAEAQTKTEIRTAEERFELSKRNLERANGLFQKKMISKNEQDEAETTAIIAELEVLRANEASQLDQLKLFRAIEILKLRSITSPINGVVVERFKSPGEYIEEQPVLKLAQLDPLNVEVIVPLAWFGKIKPGMQAKIMPEKPVGGTHIAEVKIVDPVVDAASGTLGIRLELPNPQYLIPAGLRCDIKFLTKRTQRKK